MNAADLIAEALLESANCAADIRAAALLRIARVQTVVTPDQAVATLEAGLNASREWMLTDPGFNQLVCLATAAIAPERLKDLPRPPALSRAWVRGLPGKIVSVMANHGHSRYLRTYVLEDAPASEVPLHGIGLLMSQADNDDERRLLLRRAFEAWRQQEAPAYLDEFWGLMRQHWRVLPIDEARATLTKAVDAVLQKPDGGGRHSFMEIRLDSDHAAVVFRYFALLLELDPERAEELRLAHPELVGALERYPKGWQSMLDEAEARRAQMPPDSNRRSYVVAGGQEGLQYAQALMTGEFELPLEQALAKYRDDKDPENPNFALKAFWPSTGAYGNIFWQMGKQLGESAQTRLKEVPDPEIRLLAQIEFATALCGLAQLESMSMARREKPIARTSGRR